MNNKIALTGLLLAGMLGSWSANAAPIQINWCGAVSFDTSECLFTPFQATELSIIDAKTATYGATLVEGQTFKMELEIGGSGNWVTVWQDFKKKDQGNFSIELINSLLEFTFTEAPVSGIKFSTAPANEGQEYTAFNMQQTKFIFNCVDCGGGGDDDDTTPVPEPGTLALLGLGLAGLGFSRRRSVKKS